MIQITEESMDVRELENWPGWFLHYYREAEPDETWTINWRLKNGTLVLHDYEHWRREPPLLQYRDEMNLDDEAREVIASVLTRPNFKREVNRLITEFEKRICKMARRMSKRAHLPLVDEDVLL